MKIVRAEVIPPLGAGPMGGPWEVKVLVKVDAPEANYGQVKAAVARWADAAARQEIDIGPAEDGE